MVAPRRASSAASTRPSCWVWPVTRSRAPFRKRCSSMFQMTFAIITPALVIGGFAERMRFSAVLGFSVLWLLLVYVPLAHWVWGGGWLAKLGVMDFAGGIVVHVNAGVAALVCRAGARAAPRLSAHRHDAAQPAVDGGGRGHAVGGLVRLQRRQRAGRQWLGHHGDADHAYGRIRRRAGVDVHRVEEVTASPRCWASSPAWLRASAPSRRLRDSWARWARWSSVSRPASCASSPRSCSSASCTSTTRWTCRRCTAWAASSARLLTGVFAAVALGGTGYPVQQSMLAQLGVQALGVVVAIAWCGGMSWLILKLMDVMLPPARVRGEGDRRPGSRGAWRAGILSVTRV